MEQVTRARCHCGAVVLAITDMEPLESAARCNCSFCKRRQAANITVPVAALTVEQGADALALYSFGTHTAQHYFCKTCGIYTHHRRRSDPNVYGVNIGCIDGVDPSELEPFHWHDGIDHPSDRDR
ncbi:MAG: GFA family protein [Pseudomonadota bacterium]